LTSFRRARELTLALFATHSDDAELKVDLEWLDDKIANLQAVIAAKPNPITP
jgi:hypothetical protein